MSEAAFDYDEESRSLKEYLGIFQRRKFQVIVPSLIVLVLVVLVTFLLPAKYLSKATILIEDQEVPREFVTSTITSFAAQQVQVISQRVLTTERISGIAEKYNLYVDSKTGQRPPATLMAEQFRESMVLDLVSADVIDPRSGRPQEATIAFTLSFEHPDAGMAQRLTNELVTLFLDENLRTRTERAASTGEFLAAEAADLSRELQAIEEQLARFKEDNEGALPELNQFNLGVLDRTNDEISDLETRLTELERRKLDLGAQLVQIEPWQPIVSKDGEVIPSEHGRLKALRAEFRQRSAVFRPSHPDLQRLSREIAELEAQLGVSESSEEVMRALREQKEALAGLRQRYEASSSEVVTAQRQVDDLEAKLASLANQDGPAALPQPDNPAYILIDTQLQAAVAEGNALLTSRSELIKRREKLEGLVSKAPTVEQAYSGLLREYETAQTKYRELRSKQREADVAENMETERKGERFVLVEPPNFPIRPSSPNRPALLVLGVVLAAAAGVGMALLLEAMDGAIHGQRQLVRITGAPPFAVVGYIENSDDRYLQSRFLKRLIIAGITGLIALLIFAHIFIRPLDIVWFMLLGRSGL